MSESMKFRPRFLTLRTFLATQPVLFGALLYHSDYAVRHDFYCLGGAYLHGLESSRILGDACRLCYFRRHWRPCSTRLSAEAGGATRAL